MQASVAGSQLNGAQSVSVIDAQSPFVHCAPTIAPTSVEQTAVPQAVPSATGAQVPALPFRPQEWQAPHEATSQQTPSVQWPLAHWASAVQAAPSAPSVTVGFPHALPLQLFPGAQLASVVQAVKHRLPLQAKGAQDTAAGATQLPEPSHVEGAVYEPPAHRSPPQAVPA